MCLVGRRKDPENKEADLEMEIGWTAIQMYSIDKHLSQVTKEFRYIIELNSRIQMTKELRYIIELDSRIQMYSMDKHLSQVIIEISYLIKLNSRRMEGYICTLF